MFSHIILFRFNTDVSHSDAMDLLAKLGSLTKTIPQIVAYKFGANDSDNTYNNAFTHAFVMDFLSKEDRYIYQQHSAHIEFIESHLNSVIADAIVFDMQNHITPVFSSTFASSSLSAENTNAN